MSNPRTELSSLGEFGLIEYLSKKVEIQQPSTLKGIGDDAAILNPTDLGHLVLTTDLLVEGIHFDLSYCPLKHLGYKAVSVNLSDVYAMNAIPTQITVSLALSNRFSLEAIEELYEGMLLACKKYGVDLVGGDTTSSTSGLIISITALGHNSPEKITQRSGAKEHHLVCVSGDLGGAYVGLQVLEREKNVFQGSNGIQPDLDRYPYVLERQLKPEPRQDLIEYFQKNNIIPSSMIDVSDGLASEILHLCKHSNVGIQIYENKIPIDQETHATALEMNLSPTMCALNGGEDYELLFTLPQEYYETIKDHKAISIIGYVSDKSMGTNLITPANTLVPLTAQGWDALK